MAKGSMREQMPGVAVWIDGMREAFGAASIDGAIRRGMRGEPGAFYATENGLTVGTAPLPKAKPVEWVATGREAMLNRQYELIAEDRATSLTRSRLGNNDNKGVK
ncbi:MAG: hypothetical protein ABIT83_20150 [Massilia sp.]